MVLETRMAYVKEILARERNLPSLTPKEKKKDF